MGQPYWSGSLVSPYIKSDGNDGHLESLRQRVWAAEGRWQSERRRDNDVFDEQAIAKAQKHAEWAISALNFEDVSTAIRELRGALRTLGAQ